MAIEASLKGVTDFLQKNEGLIELIKDTGQDATDKIKTLSDQLEANRDEAEQMVDQINQMQFRGARDTDTRQRQRLILGKIEQVSKDIQTFADEPDILIMLYSERGGLYMALGNTFNDPVGQIVTFSPEEIDDLRVLLRRATLDTESRMQIAHILDASVQVSKLLLRVAGKLVA
jgi:TolA-binding protein